MVEEIAALATATAGDTGKGAFNGTVMAAMGKVPRERFVPADQQAHAYANRPLPIGYGQTISQPYIVALMTDLLRPQPDHEVLEIGTGSGYQAAVLAELVKSVSTIEIIEPLGTQAESRLKQYANVQVRIGDGYYGWNENSAFDSIIVTAAAGHVPPPLIRQLKAGGRMVIPLGAPFLPQQLMLVEKKVDGTVSTSEILPVQFVPMTGTARP